MGDLKLIPRREGGCQARRAGKAGKGFHRGGAEERRNHLGNSNVAISLFRDEGNLLAAGAALGQHTLHLLQQGLGARQALDGLLDFRVVAPLERLAAFLPKARK